jgi:predicted permease
MQSFLKFLFALMLVAMLAMTTAASLDRGVFQALGDLWKDLWFKVTLMDAYFGFMTFYVWVAYKESRNLARILWFVLIMCFGNIAMATYVLIQLFRMTPGESMETLLTKRVT